MQYGGLIDQIGNKFGAIGVTQFKGQLMDANEEFTEMGLGMEDLLTSTESLSKNFGISTDKAIEMSNSVGDLAQSTGISVDQSAELVGYFSEMQGVSSETAMNTLKSAEALAVAEGVAPGVILKDIANSTEAFAKFGGAGAENMMRAAIQARKLGIDLNKVASSAEGMLDFQSSLNNEIEASIMLGRNVNLQKARELSLSGDLEGLQKEILNIIGSEAEWNQMNVLQRQSLAKALNMNVADLDKMVRKEKEAVTLTGIMAGHDLSKIIPDEKMSEMSKTMAELQAKFLEISTEVGPELMGLFGDMAKPLVSMVGSIAQFIVGLNETIGIVPLLIGYLSSALTKQIMLFGTSLAAAYTKGAATPPSPLTLALITGMPLVVGGIVTGVMSAISGASEVGDAKIPAKGRPMVSTKEGGVFQGTRNDDVLMGPGLAAAAGTEKVVSSTATKPHIDDDITGLMRKNLMAMRELINDHKAYFDVGGTLARETGRQTAGAISTQTVVVEAQQAGS